MKNRDELCGVFVFPLGNRLRITCERVSIKFFTHFLMCHLRKIQKIIFSDSPLKDPLKKILGQRSFEKNLKKIFLGQKALEKN